MTRVGREIRMLDNYYLEGDATSHERILRDGIPDWDLDVVAGPRGSLLFALDLDYQPDLAEKVFQFGPPREVQLRFPLPAYARKPREVFRLDADGTTPVEHTEKDDALEIGDHVSRVAIYGRLPVRRTRPDRSARQEFAGRGSVARVRSGRNASDLEVLKQLLTPARK